MTQKQHKPVIETVINTVAIALTAWGVTDITTGGWNGYVAIAFGMLLEGLKYWGRNKNYW